MPRRWVWSLLDIAALICLGQATMMAQRQASLPPSRLDAIAESRAQAGGTRLGTRIFETPGSVVVALKVPAEEPPAGVAVEADAIRVFGRETRAEIPVPSGADPARYTVRRAGDEVRVIFAKGGLQAARD